MSNSRHTDPLFLGASYGIGLFVFGLILGIVRNVWLIGIVGEPIATFIEIPVMLVVAWVWCGRLTSRSWLGRSVFPRLVMGLVGLLVLTVLELLGAVAVEGSLSPYLSDFHRTERLAGLSAQIFAAFIPALRR